MSNSGHSSPKKKSLTESNPLLIDTWSLWKKKYVVTLKKENKGMQRLYSFDSVNCKLCLFPNVPLSKSFSSRIQEKVFLVYFHFLSLFPHAYRKKSFSYISCDSRKIIENAPSSIWIYAIRTSRWLYGIKSSPIKFLVCCALTLLTCPS